MIGWIWAISGLIIVVLAVLTAGEAADDWRDFVVLVFLILTYVAFCVSLTWMIVSSLLGEEIL